MTPENRSILEVVKETPLKRLRIETDSGEPAEVKDVANKIAELKGMNVDELGYVTTSNLRNLLGI